MMDVFSLAVENLTSPVILFFVLGVAAAALRSDLEIPPAIGKTLALYLMVSIGFKGGVELAKSELSGTMLAVATVAIALSLLMPFAAFRLLRATTQLDRVNAAAVAATYGSVSVVTFVTAVAFLGRSGVAFAGYFVAVLALMEMPSIVSSVVLARGPETTSARTVFPRAVLREALVSGSVLLLLGGLLIGLATGARGVATLGPVLIGPFHGILAIFLLEMGLIVVRRLRESGPIGWPLVAFALYMPLLGAAVGLLLARVLGLAPGDGTLLAVLAASASYIAVPAALRHTLPEANPSIYVTLSLAITFPFNVILGIPLYHAAANLIL